MLALVLVAVQQTVALPPQVADTSPFRPLDLPAASVTRAASGSPGAWYWQQQVDYTIRASLDTATEVVSGTVAMCYHNNSPDTLRYLWLHLEQNLFRPDSRGAALNAPPNSPGMDFAGTWFSGAGITVTSAAAPRSAGGSIQRTPLRTRVNGTLLRVDLDLPLAPRDSATVTLDFHYEVPEVGTFRTVRGRMGDGLIYQIAQWYPRAVVYDDVRGWNTDQYLGNGEFYLEYGDFDVFLTVPRSLVLAATGSLVNGAEVLTAEQQRRLHLALHSDTTVAVIPKEEAGRLSARPAGASPTLTWHFRADRVRDFAWAASTNFRWDAIGWNGILAQAFYPATYPPDWVWQGWPPDSTWAHSAELVRFAIRQYSEQWFPYPYPTATNVHGPTGSMEYPMLCFCGTGASVRDLTGVTLHEMAHQWFPMIVGSNERLHAWMDEGFAEFLKIDGWHAAYPADARAERGDSTDHWTRSASGWALIDRWISAAVHGRDEPPMIAADRARIGWSQYSKTPAALYLLRHRGQADSAAFDDAFREYIRRWSFKHPTPADFFRTMNDALGEDLSWFWRGVFYRTDVVDLALDSVVVTVDSMGRRSTGIHISSRGALPMRVPLRVTLDDGTTESARLPVEVWYRGNHYVYVRASAGEVMSVEIDPDHMLPDVRRQNDVWQRERGAP